MPSRPPEFLELPLEELVKQMTLIDQRYFFNIKLKEYANKVSTEIISNARFVKLCICHFDFSKHIQSLTIIIIRDGRAIIVPIWARTCWNSSTISIKIHTGLPARSFWHLDAVKLDLSNERPLLHDTFKWWRYGTISCFDDAAVTSRIFQKSNPYLRSGNYCRFVNNPY